MGRSLSVPHDTASIWLRALVALSWVNVHNFEQSLPSREKGHLLICFVCTFKNLVGQEGLIISTVSESRPAVIQEKKGADAQMEGEWMLGREHDGWP